MGFMGPFGRTVPPVYSTVSMPGVARAVGIGVLGGTEARQELRRALSERYDASTVVLADSGTSALVLAYRLVSGRNRSVAIPAFGCPDLVSAALIGGLRLRLYDLDPFTLNPDLTSLEAAARRGLDAIVVVHFFGFPVDLDPIKDLSASLGVHLIEDAAQGAGGRFKERPLGSFGDLSILSFGRGKGITGGGGGALLIRQADLAKNASNRELPETHHTAWGALSVAVAQRVLARPALYGIPASIPSLKLGEMVFRAAGDPLAMGCGNAALALDALGRLDEETRGRTAIARRIQDLIPRAGRRAGPCQAIPEGHPGYLRLPAVLPYHQPVRALGIVRAYPVTLAELPEARSALFSGEGPGPGSTLLSRALLTLPTHTRVAESDLKRIELWASRSQNG